MDEKYSLFADGENTYTDISRSTVSISGMQNNEQRHVLRLLIFRPGDVLQRVPTSAYLLKQIGLFAVRMDETLKEFYHPAYDFQTSLWVLPAAPKLRDFLFAVSENENVAIVNEIIIAFEQKVLPIVDHLDKGIIHGDLNECNIVVNPDGTDVAAIIDFGDSHKNCYIFELAICMCYMLVQTKSIEMISNVVEGYQMIRKLTKQEKEILKLCICARLCQSLVLGAYSYQREPNNTYLIISQESKWTLLKKLWPMNDNDVMSIWGLN